MFDQTLQRRIVAADKSTQAVRTASGLPGVRTVDDQLSADWVVDVEDKIRVA